MHPLNERQRRFAHEYLIDLDGANAAIRAGYAKCRAHVTAHNLLKRPDVQEIIREARDKINNAADVDALYVLKGAKEMFERCMQRKPVLDKHGNPTGDWKFNAAGAGQALKILGDHVDVCAFKATDDDGIPVDQNWRVTIVGTDGKTKKVLGPENT